MLVLFMLLVLMAPFPIFPLLFVFEPFVIDIRLVPFVQPAPVSLVLAPIPVMVVATIRVVYPSFSFFLLVPLVLVLRSSHS
jgi:hypothetical protein